MKFNLPKKLNYHISEGHHAVKLEFLNYSSDVKGCTCSCPNKVRMTFVGISNPRSLEQDAAGIAFCLEREHSADLLEFLTSWLGKDLENYIDEAGSIDLDALDGRQAIITIDHWIGRKGRHEYPFCKIVRIRPYRSLASQPSTPTGGLN